MKKFYDARINPWAPVFDGETTFTQEQVDVQIQEATKDLVKAEDVTTQISEAVATAITEHKNTSEGLLGEIDLLKKKTTLTSEDKTKLEERVEALQNQMLSKEELTKKEQKKQDTAHETALNEANAQGTKWQNLFTNTQIDNAITAAAVEHGGFSVEQFNAILRPISKLTEEVGKEGPTGKYITLISFEDVDSAGKAIKLDLSPSDAVKRMKEIDKYQNLFVSKGKSGLQLINVKKTGDVDLRELAKDTVAYRQAKKDGVIT